MSELVESTKRGVCFQGHVTRRGDTFERIPTSKKYPDRCSRCGGAIKWDGPTRATKKSTLLRAYRRFERDMRVVLLAIEDSADGRLAILAAEREMRDAIARLDDAKKKARGQR